MSSLSLQSSTSRPAPQLMLQSYDELKQLAETRETVAKCAACYCCILTCPPVVVYNVLCCCLSDPEPNQDSGKGCFHWMKLLDHSPYSEPQTQCELRINQIHPFNVCPCGEDRSELALPHERLTRFLLPNENHTMKHKNPYGPSFG